MQPIQSDLGTCPPPPPYPVPRTPLPSARTPRPRTTTPADIPHAGSRPPRPVHRHTIAWTTRGTAGEHSVNGACFGALLRWGRRRSSRVGTWRRAAVWVTAGHDYGYGSLLLLLVARRHWRRAVSMVRVEAIAIVLIAKYLVIAMVLATSTSTRTTTSSTSSIASTSTSSSAQ